MVMVKMRATRPLRYETRRLVAGDEFEVDRRHVKVLKAIKKAEVVRAPAVVPPPSPVVAEKIAAAVAPVSTGDLAALRAEYESVVGRKPFLGWGETVLREKIAAARTAGG